MVSCGMKCIKYLLFFFNLIFFIAGLALIVIGALVQTKFSTYFTFFGNSMNAAAILLIVIGVVMFVIGFFGCCGACKESVCMVKTFAMLLIVVLILEVAAAITGFVLKDKVNDLIDGQLQNTIKQYKMNVNEGLSDAWNLVQPDLKCCGAHNYTDWLLNAELSENDSVPWSCCVDGVKGSDCGKGQAGVINPPNIYHEGCVNNLINWFGQNIIIIGAVAAAFAFIQVFGIIIACCLAHAISKEYDVV